MSRGARALAVGLLAACALPLPARADCYDILGCSNRDLFSKHFGYLGSVADGPNCSFLKQMRYAILLEHRACSDGAETATGPGSCRGVDPARVRLSAVERANLATIGRAEALKRCPR